MQDTITREAIERGELARAVGRSQLQQDSSEREALLVVRVGIAWFALGALAVLELCDWSVPTPLPCAPPHVPGLINFRGRAVPILDLGRYLGLPALDVTSRDVRFRIAVIAEAGMQVGLVCEQALGVLEIARSSLASPELFQGRKESVFVRAQVDIPGGVAGVVDLGRLLQATKVSE